MDHIGAYEARSRFAHLLDEVERGRAVTITRNGFAVARLVPASTPVGAVVAELRLARRAIRLPGGVR